MKAKLLTYTTEKLTPTQRSILSKKINGYTDKSNKAKYTYKRKSVLAAIPHIKISKKTFIVGAKDFTALNQLLTKHKTTVKSWDIAVKDL
ncbi:hypothetical protein COV14_03690 [Candidatus Woesearchaeota archaeon CG10_big_fil_rev_8_21_14_0_10_33_12]|nr:MAG: hypothetical protein COV14_03690 [Candidatus Woesearchaeota archaeon CG10_big_fil_rev_8_21_14_0_10_33_12]